MIELDGLIKFHFMMSFVNPVVFFSDGSKVVKNFKVGSKEDFAIQSRNKIQT